MFTKSKNWIKEKWQRFKKWLIGLFGIGVVLAAGVIALPEKVPVDLQLKVPAERVVHQIEKGVHSTSTVDYFYISDEELSTDDYYFAEGRSYSSGQYIQKGSENIISFNGEKNYKDRSGKVYKVKKATTTKEFFEKQTKKSLLSRLLNNSAIAQTTDTYTSNDTWTAPAGVTSVEVEAWGGGGAGGGSSSSKAGGGGGGGAYSKTNTITVVPSTGYTVTVGQGGTGVSAGNGNSGGDSGFDDNSQILAKGGTGGISRIACSPESGTGSAGGQASSGIGDVKYSGGTGGNCSTSTGYGGGGGGGAGDANNGGNGSGRTGGTGGSVEGGNGGTGGGMFDGGKTAGSTLSGGGGGSTGGGPNITGASGARGEVRITYTVAASDTCTYTSGDWIVNYSDNCEISSDVWIDSGSSLHIIRDGAGSFKVTNGAKIYNQDGAVFIQSPESIIIQNSSNGVIFKK